MLAGVGSLEGTLFSNGQNTRLSLADVKILASGVVVLIYQF
jgi:hypothetical protein